MAIASAADARGHGGFRRLGGGGGLALAAALDRALLAAQRLRDTLDTAARQQAELATQLARVLALAGPCAPHDAGRMVCPTHIVSDEGRAARSVSTRTPTSLSPREREVLGLLAAGQSNRRIAQALCLGTRTVRRHGANAYLKIGAHNKAEATAYALRRGLA